MSARPRRTALVRTLFATATVAVLAAPACSTCDAVRQPARDAGASAGLNTPSAPAPVSTPARGGASGGPQSLAKAKALTRAVVGPSLLRVTTVEGGFGTAFACVIPGIACTAKHIVGDRETITVRAPDGRSIEAPVVATHPEDDVALLDIRGLGLRPLPVSHLDAPPEGVLVCRLGHPPSHLVQPFLRCDPLGGVLIEASPRGDGSVLPRLIHLGLGFKGDSGSPVFDPSTQLVVGIHVSEGNGSCRAAVASTVHDLLTALRAKNPLAGVCAPDGPTDLWKRTMLLSCVDLVDDARASHFRHLGGEMLARGRRAEALGAFEEAIELDPHGAMGWLWRALVFPASDHARDDAAFAFRLDETLRNDETLALYLPAAFVPAARALRDEVAPKGARLATLVGDGGCDACPAFCAAAREKKDVRLWAVEGLNHAAALTYFESLAPPVDGGVADGGALRPLVAIGERAAYGCGSLAP